MINYPKDVLLVLLIVKCFPLNSIGGMLDYYRYMHLTLRVIQLIQSVSRRYVMSAITHRCRIIHHLFLFLLSLFCSGWVLGEQISLVHPVKDSLLSTKHSDLNPDDLSSIDPSIIRRANVTFPTNFLDACRSATTNDLLNMRLFESSENSSSTEFLARLGKHDVASTDKAVSLAGILADCEFQTVLITANDERVRITIQDLDSGMLYRVSGDLKTGKGKVVEIDPAKMPPIIYSPPLVPGKEKSTTANGDTP